MRFSNILFIAPIFHLYHEKIIQALKAAGANVDFYPERDYGLKFKLLNNISQNLLTEYQCKHYRNILKKISTDNIEYDCLFVIRGFMMPAEFLIKFKTLFPNAKLLMYQWDSNRTNRFSHLVQYFDKVLSFDFKDSDDFSLEYLPLFYTKDLIPYKKESPKVYDFFFMGTYLPERYSALVKFKEKYENSYTIKSFIYIPKSSWVKEYLKGIKLSKEVCHTVPIGREEYLSILSKTRVMVDVSNKAQTGLAMRIIEALSLGVKVATNNNYILKDPLFNVNNICIFDADNPIINEDFVLTPFYKAECTLSIDEWINKIFQNYL